MQLAAVKEQVAFLRRRKKGRNLIGSHGTLMHNVLGQVLTIAQSYP